MAIRLLTRTSKNKNIQRKWLATVKKNTLMLKILAVVLIDIVKAENKEAMVDSL
jgi:hypothetical protein